MITEVCAPSLLSAVNAGKAGAHRVELCSELVLGGVTPSYALIKKVVELLDIPVYVLIRPRSGGFTYSREELEVMRNDVAMCADLGCAGVVCGVLKKDHRIDTVATAGLMEAAGEMDFTFHRAFDWVPDQEEGIERLLQIGCSRVLTSGARPTAEEGLDALVTLERKYGDEIIVMPGGGVTERNIGKFKTRGFREIHFSATRLQHQSLPLPKISFYPKSLPDEREIYVSDPAVIKRMVNLVK
ncbi:copper homeostasis protein CutC [Robertkochia flava]|uniref:copper homeostasis protein CutC n=1 Tax=Robertkochia flava TaxID=3447986 RepID=UPI001CCBE394|nr:copper homeostasis protein CutC [Robertkochia marina]